jgi:CRP-like cAMP-binding protein
MNDGAAKDLLRRTGWLAGEPAWLVDALLGCARITSWKADELIYLVGDEPGGIYGLAQGGIGVLLPSGGSEMVLAHVLRPGAWFGLGPILAKSRRTLTFRTVEPCRTAQVSLADLNAIGQRNPDLFRRLGALSEAGFYNLAIRIVGDLLIPSGEKRVAAVLARIAGTGHAAPLVTEGPIRLSQAMIGQMSNCSRDRVNQALRKFAASGWIRVDYRQITVINLAALETFARGEENN